MERTNPAADGRIVSDVGWTLAGAAVYRLSLWAMLALLTKLRPPQVAGDFCLGLAIAGPIYVCTGLQLEALLATETAAWKTFSDYVTLRSTGIAAGSAVAIAWAASGSFSRSAAAAIVAVAALKAVETAGDLVFAFLLRHRRMRRLASTRALRGVVAVSVFAGLVSSGAGLAPSLVAVAVAWAALLLALDLPAASRLPGGELKLLHWDRRALGGILAMGVPLGVTMALISLTATAPRLALERFAGGSALAVLSALLYLGRPATEVFMAAGQAMSPRLAEAFGSGDTARFRRLVLGLCALAALLGLVTICVCAAFGELVLSKLYTPWYGQFARLLVPLMLAGLLGNLASALGYATTASRRIRHQTSVMLGVLAATIASALALVPRGGLEGAVECLILSAGCSLAGYALLMALPPDATTARTKPSSGQLAEATEYALQNAE